VPLAVILRKCQVLAVRLDHEPLRDWARSELEGYAVVADLPAYRKIGPLEAVGAFVQGGIRHWPRLPIPRAVIPAQRHERLFAHQFLSGVAQLELEAASAANTFIISWPSDDIARYGEQIYHGMTCIEAHVEITPRTIAGALDTIRNRVLTFSLELWREDPEAGDASAARQPAVEPERVNQIFHTYLLGEVGAVNIGGGQIDQTMNVTVVPGDIESLRTALADLGITRDVVGDLEQALADDAASEGGPGALGPATATWLERFSADAGEQAIVLANGVSAGLLTELLMRYLS
jgi:hypothetical protein